MATLTGQNTPSMTPEEQYETGFTYRCEGKYGVARQFFNQVLDSEPKHLKARWQLALIAGFEGDFDGSLEALKQLNEEAPANTDIKYDYAMTLMMLGYFDEACAAFHEVLALDPNHEKASQQLAYCP